MSTAFADEALVDGEWRMVRGVLRWVEDVRPPEVRELRALLRPVPPTRDFDPNLIACPTCLATITQACRSTGGHTSTHLARLVSRRCLCGDVLEPRKQYCERCRKRARKETYRRREIRKATARRRRESGESLSTKGQTVLAMSGETWENRDGPSRAVDATRPGPDRLPLLEKEVG